MVEARVLLVGVESLPEALRDECRQCCQHLATLIGEDVLYAVSEQLPEVRNREYFGPEPATATASMAAAPFLWRDDGRPDWASMWTTFCELALYGGPPHRAESNMLRATDDVLIVDDRSGTIAELRRGIWETTGLFSEPAGPGWIAVTCASRRMAAWLCATILLENVDARCDEERLLLPSSPVFTLENEIKSVVTVLAKTHHYWQAHVESGP